MQAAAWRPKWLGHPLSEKAGGQGGGGEKTSAVACSGENSVVDRRLALGAFGVLECGE